MDIEYCQKEVKHEDGEKKVEESVYDESTVHRCIKISY
jgi:hypothetical protein